MDGSVRLGRIGGVGISGHWSLAVVFWLVTWTLADVVLETDAPGYTTTEYWIAGVLAAVTFFVCLLGHEISHAMVARRAGLPVEGITLWLFGGLARLGGDAPDARTELRIAVAGPAASIGLGFGLALLSVLLSPLGDLVTSSVAWLARINFVLAVFNLAPAFPLDGGRVLRALLWRRSGDRLGATEKATTAGRAFGYVLMGFGLLAVTAGDIGSGVWLVFLGWFVLAAGRAELGAIEAGVLLGDTAVRDVMTSHPVTVLDSLTLDDLLHDYVLGTRHSAFPVVDRDGELRGLMTLDGIRAVTPGQRHRTLVGASAIPVDRLVVVSPDDPLSSLVEQLPAGRRAVVVERSRVVGVVAPSDLQAALVRARLLRVPAAGPDHLPPTPAPPGGRMVGARTTRIGPGLS